MPTTIRARTLRRSRPDRAAPVLLAVLFLLVGAGRASGEPSSARGATASPSSSSTPQESPPVGDAARPPPGTILLLLPTVTGPGGNWIATWTDPGAAGRFAPLEADLSARWKALGYGTMTAREALASADAATALRDAPRPIPPEAAAAAARAARATLALVVRAEALRRTESKRTFTDALVTAEVYRAADAVKLAWASTRASGTGATEEKSDAESLAHAAGPLIGALSAPLLAAVGRPVIAPHPITIVIEGDLGYRDYRRLLGLLQHQIPEIRVLEERRFSHGRQTLRAICGCQPWDIAQRLDGRTTGGFTFEVRSDLDAVRVRARPARAGGVPP